MVDSAFGFIKSRRFNFHPVVLHVNLQLPKRPFTVHRLDKVFSALQTVVSQPLTRRSGQQVCTHFSFAHLRETHS